MENLNEEQLDAIINAPLPGIDTGVGIGKKYGWNMPTPANVSALEDGEDVLVNKEGKVRQLKWNKASGAFESRSFVPTGEKTLVYSQTGQVIPKDVTKESIELITPDKVDAFAAGASALETARDSAIAATPGALGGIGGFMLGMGALGGPETPLGWIGGVAGSMAAASATDAVMKYGFKIEPSEQDAINAQLNPTASTLGSFAPTLLAFRPSGSLLKAAAGFETAGMTQAQALGQVAKGGLTNMALAQGSATAEALVHGAPGTDRLTAAARTIGFGDPTKDWGGGWEGIGDRLLHAGKEFGLGAGVLHKTWGPGALMHNAAAYATGGKPSTYVKMSGAPTWDAIRAQAMDRQAARLAQQAQVMRDVTGQLARERGITEEQVPVAPGQAVDPTISQAQKLTPEQQVGLTQVKAALAEALKRNIIDQETHDTANLVADTMGADLLKHIQLRQVGGREGTSLGSSNAVFEDGRGVFNAVKVFASAIKSNKFQFTLSHEILHPLFQSLKPEIQAEIKNELIKQRAKARASNKAMDYILSKLGIENDSTWDFDKFTLSQAQMVDLAAEMKAAGIKIPNGMFEARTADDGSVYYRLRPGYEESVSGRRVYRLKDAHEFFSDEGARIIKNRGEYDSKWGSQKWYDVVAMIQSMYHGMRKALQSTGFGEKMIGKRSQIDVIMDRIAEGNFGEVSMSGKGEIAADAQIKSDLAPRLKDIDTSKVGDALEALTKGRESNEAAVNDALRGVLATGETPEQTQRIRDAIRNEGGEVTLSNRFLSEGDVDPANPPAAKGTDQILAKLGIKRTVAANVVQHRKIGAIEGFDVMDTPEKVTHAFRNIGHMAQESIQMLVTDKNHRPLEIIRHTMSEPGSSSLSATAMATQIASIKGAAHVWVTHNHPSETPTFSYNADVPTGGALMVRVLRGLGVKPMGFFAQAGEMTSAFMDGEGKVHGIKSAQLPTAADGLKKIPIVERRFEFKRGTGKDFMEDTPIDTRQNARDFVEKTIGDKAGVIFLDKYNRPVGTHELRFTPDGNLGRVGARDLAGAFSRTGAEKLVVSTGGIDIPSATQEALAQNVMGMFQQIKAGGKPNPVKMVVTMDKSGNVNHTQANEQIDQLSIRQGWKSEGDAEAQFPSRIEYESRVGATTIKPLHAAPKVKFPIPADKLKKFGIDRGHMNQFSEHAVVGKVESPVETVTNHEEAAMFIDDYAGHLVQGQTMILITDKNGKPLQVGLHMIHSDTSTSGIYKPMMGVLAGQAISTPGAREAWFIRINNGEYGGLGKFKHDDALNNIDALRNLLDGTGIDFRGALSISDGRYSFNPLMGFDAKAGPGASIDNLTVTNKQIPVSVSGEKHSFKITERRYSSRTQVSYQEGAQRPDAAAPNPVRGRSISPEAWNRAIEEQLGKKSGIVFAANSGAITAVYPMTMAEMKNIRGTGAHRALLAMADRAGTNWATIHLGDADRTVPGTIGEMQDARFNVGRFLTQAGVKADTVMFRDKKGVVQELDSVYDNPTIKGSQMTWKSEGDQDGVPLHKRDLRKDVPTWRQSEPSTTPPKWNDPEFTGDASGKYRQETPRSQFTQAEIEAGNFKFSTINMNGEKASKLMPKPGQEARRVPQELHDLLGMTWPEYGGKGIDHAAMQHVPEFFLAYPELRSLWDTQSGKFKDWYSENKYKKFVKEKVMAQLEGRDGFAYFMTSEAGADKTKMDTIRPEDASENDVATILSKVGGVYFEINVTNSGSLKTAFPISKSRYEAKIARATRFSDVESRSIERLHAKQVVRGAEPMTGKAKDLRATIKDIPPTYRGSKELTAFSEGDAAEYGDRAERAIQQDTIVGPEAIRGDFIGWVKSIKELANEHLYQHPFPGNSGDYEGDIARDKSRLAKHAVIDQVLAKLERQKGFNPMTLKAGMLKQLQDISREVYAQQFHEIARTGMVMVEHIEDDLPRRHAEYQYKASLKYNEGFIKQIYTGMQAGMISKKTGMELVDMANEMRSRLVYTFERKFPGDGTRMSEGDAENMMIPGGARERAMNARPKKQVKTYLNIGHGDIKGEYGNAQYTGNFKPEDTFLYSYNHKDGKFAVRNVADLANEEDVQVKGPADFAHGIGENGIETGIGLRSRQTGMHGRIEIDHENQTILVSAGQGRGELDPFRVSPDNLNKRRDALKEIRSYVENMQKKGELPAGYKVEGYGFPGPFEREALGYKGDFQERFSEGDSTMGDFAIANHSDQKLGRAGFITKYASENMPDRYRERFVLEVMNEDGDVVPVGSLVGNGNVNTNMTIVMRDMANNGSPVGDVYLYFNQGKAFASIDGIEVRQEYRNKGLSKILYAEVGERLRRMGVETLEGFVVDELQRPIPAREAVFGEDSTTAKHLYFDEPQPDGSKRRKWSAAEVKTNIDPARRLSEGDVEMPPASNPKTNIGEVANHTDVQLAKRGFITLRAKENAKSMAGMKMTIKEGRSNETFTTKREGIVGQPDEDGMGEFHGVIEYNGENGLQKVASFTYSVMPGNKVRGERKFDGGGDLDWIKVEPIWRNRDISTVIVAEVAERIRRSYGNNITAFVVDPEGRPIKALNRVLGEGNVQAYDNGFEETSPRDQFAQQGPDGEYVRRSWDVEGTIRRNRLLSEGDESTKNYEGLAFSEADVRRFKSQTPAERTAFRNSLPDKRNRDEFQVMLESMRQRDFDNRPGAPERRAKHEARRQEVIEKYRAQGHPYPEVAAENELFSPPTGVDPEVQLEQMRRRQSDRNKLNSEGDGENMRIPGGARDRFQRQAEGIKRQKPIRFWTDVGHAERTDAEGEQNTYLWYATKKGDIQVISADDLRSAHSPEGYQLIDSSDIPTHLDWEQHLENGNIDGDYGKQPITDLPHGRIDDRGDVTRISFMDHHNSGRTDYEFRRDEIKKKLAEYMGKKADEMPGYDFTSTVTKGTGPDRFSEGDAENGRWAKQERAKGKIPNARFNNGETDLGFTLGPGEELDSRGGILRDSSIRNFSWGEIGHDPLQYKTASYTEANKESPEKLIARLEDEGRLQTEIDFGNGLFAYDQRSGRFEAKTDWTESSHANWLGVEGGTELMGSKSGEFNSKFGVIPEDYSYLGRIEPAIVAKDGTVERRGRISLGFNKPGDSWLNDAHDMLKSGFPEGFIQKLKEHAAKQNVDLVRAKGEPLTAEQKASPDDFDVYGFGMKSDKSDMGISRKDFGPMKMSEGDSEVMRDVSARPIGEGKEGQTRLKAIAARMSEGDADRVEEPPFRVPNVAPGASNLQIAKDIVTARFFTGISKKAHDNAAEFPLSPTMRRIADMIHTRGGADVTETSLDLPTSIMKERTRLMNQFFEIMSPLRGDYASMSRDAREAAYRDLADMVTGVKPLDNSTAGRAAKELKKLLQDMHQYRVDAGEKKLGEVADYFPAVYDSIRISEDAMAFKDDAKRAYMIELASEFQGQELDAAAEKAARELTMSHIRGESAGMFNSFFEEAGPNLGENSSKSRTFGPEAQEIMSKWQVKDPYRIISRYISGATKRAELVRRLGDEGQEWRRMAKALEKEGVSYEKIDEMRDLLKDAVGIGRSPNSRGAQTFIDLMGLYTAGSVMGRSFLNNMFEPGSMGIRSGNLGLGLLAYGETWGRTLRNAARTISGERIDKTFWEKYAEHIGTISADINDAWMNSHSIEVDGDRADPRIGWLTSKVYQANLLQLTENAKLQASHAIGYRYLMNLAEMQQGRSFMNRLDVTESVRSNLRELGIEDADHSSFARWVLRLQAMDDVARMRTLTNGGRMAELFEKAITKFSMQSSVRANRAHKPVFQDGPIGKTLFQLMSYSYAYAAEVNSRTYNYAKASLKSAPAGKSYSVGDRIRFMAPLMMVPMGVIAFRAMFDLKDELYPTEYSKKHENDPSWMKWLNATSFGGVFGPKVEMATKYVMRDQPPGGPLGQTAIGLARAAKTGISNAIEGKPQNNAQRQLAKASIQPLKAAATIGGTMIHPVAGTIASQLSNTTGWSNAMTETDKEEEKKRKRK